MRGAGLMARGGLATRGKPPAPRCFPVYVDSYASRPLVCGGMRQRREHARFSSSSGDAAASTRLIAQAARYQE